MNVNEWKERLKAKVEGEGPLPAPDVSWDALEAGMAGIERRRIAWRWTGAVAAVAAVIAGVALVLPWSRSDANGISPIIADSIIAETESKTVDEARLLAMADVRPGRKTSPAQPKEVYAPETVAACDVETAADESNDGAEPAGVHNAKSNLEERPSSEENATIVNAAANANISEDDALWAELGRETNRKPRRGKLSLGIGSGFVAGSNIGDADYSAPPMDDPNPGGIMTDPAEPSTSSKESITLGFPTSFGVSAKYAFNKRFFVLGGLSATSCNVSSKAIDGERLWYFGPSVGAGVNLYQNTNFSAYSAASGKLDWCVSRRDLPLLPSMNLSAGVQFRLGSVTWLYAEPQLEYAFRSENSVAKVSFENPVQFALSVGLRLDL